jgi:lysophospholipase L1-like esterase
VSDLKPDRELNARYRSVRWVVLAIVAFLVAMALVITELALQTSYAQDLYREVRRRPPHPFLQVVPGGQVDHVNADGFRGDPVDPIAPPGTFRIVTVGGSTTLGVTNTYEDSYPFLLQSLLRTRHPDVRIEVLNAGSAWYTSAHDLVAYQVKVRRFKPDLVIFFEAINDLVRSFSPPWFALGSFKPDYSHYLGPYIGLAGPEVRFTGAATRWLTWSYFRKVLHGEPDPRGHRDPDNVARLAALMRPVDQPAFRSLPSFREYVDALVHAVEADGHRIFVASQASLYRSDLSREEERLLFFGPVMAGDGETYPSTEAMKNGMRLFNEAAREIARARGVRFLDFDAAVPKTSAHFSDDAHLRRAGNEILARLAADAIDADNLVDRARKTAAPDR